MNLLRNFFRLSIMPIPPGMRPSGSSDFSLQGLAQNTNVYAEAALKITTSGTAVNLTTAQVLAKNIVLESGASGPFSINLPATSKIIDALGPTMPLDGSFFFELSLWNNATGETGTLVAGDSSTTIDSVLLPTDTVCKWMVQVNAAPPGVGRPTTLSIIRTSTAVSVGAAGSGTVVSVAQTVPPEFTITGSPVTTTGTLAIDKANEDANTVWAGPTTGSPAPPTFRALVADDLPGGAFGTVTSVGLTMPTEFAVANSPVTTAGTLAVTKNVENANTVWAGPASGAPAQPTFRALTQADLTAVNLWNWTWGDGSDGDVDMNGTNTYAAFSTTTGSAPNLVYTLTRPIWTTNFSVANGITVIAADYQIFCQGTSTIDGTVSADGTTNTVNKGNAESGTGIGANGIYVGGTTSGAAGNGVSAPNVGQNSSTTGCLGGKGGAGGASATPQAGAAGGSANVNGLVNTGGRHLFGLLFYMTAGYVKSAGATNFVLFCGGSGGGGGGGISSVCLGGSGGSGAGIFAIMSRLLTGSGRLGAKGGDGNRGDWQAPGGGGGGGGGGGAIGVVTTSPSWQPGITVDVSGGIGGATSGGGVAGSNGDPGLFVSIIVGS